MRLYLLYFFSFLLVKPSNSQDFAELENLLPAQERFIAELDLFANALNAKIATIESFLVEVREARQQWSRNPGDYVANPLNSFKLIRRLHEDWTYIEIYMVKPVGSMSVRRLSKLIMEAEPRESQLTEAMKAVRRLQNFYDLNATQLARGIIDGQQHGFQLNSLDCFAMAEFCMIKSSQHLALDWYREALERYDPEQDIQLYQGVYGLSIFDLYGKYATLMTENSNVKGAIELLNNAADLRHDLWRLRKDLLESGRDLSTGSQFVKKAPIPIQRGCQGQFPNAPKLFCFFEKKGNTFLNLAPFKVELLSSKPYIVLYHNVIYEKEIGKLLTSDHHHRSANSHEFVRLQAGSKFNQRMTDMTGKTFSNHFLLTNHGLDGQSTTEYLNRDQERLGASITFFLSNVPQGGATIYPNQLLYVKPEKGTALIAFITNKEDQELEEFSCPVLVGPKWSLAQQLYARR